MNALRDDDYVNLRADLITQAERVLANTPGVTGATILIPRPDGGLEEVYVPKRKGGKSGRPS